ncbi:MAG: hypothetical protein WD377_05820 [Nitriliruptoraceae bacterium]
MADQADGNEQVGAEDNRSHQENPHACCERQPGGEGDGDDDADGDDVDHGGAQIALLQCDDHAGDGHEQPQNQDDFEHPVDELCAPLLGALAHHAGLGHRRSIAGLGMPTRQRTTRGWWRC